MRDRAQKDTYKTYVLRFQAQKSSRAALFCHFWVEIGSVKLVYNQVKVSKDISTMDECIVCKIVSGELPSHKVYEDEQVIAFLDIHPANQGHTLVAHKSHIEQLWDLDDSSFQYVMGISKKIAVRIRDVLNPFRVGVMVEGLEIPHAHYHLVPLNEGIKTTLNNQKMTEPNHDALAATAQKLFFS